MLLALPAAVWVAVFVARLGDRRSAREGALVAVSVVGVAILVFTEVLSQFDALSLGPLAACWTPHHTCRHPQIAHRRRPSRASIARS
jgi:hypothetical protein